MGFYDDIAEVWLHPEKYEEAAKTVLGNANEALEPLAEASSIAFPGLGLSDVASGISTSIDKRRKAEQAGQDAKNKAAAGKNHLIQAPGGATLEGAQEFFGTGPNSVPKTPVGEEDLAFEHNLQNPGHVLGGLSGGPMHDYTEGKTGYVKGEGGAGYGGKFSRPGSSGSASMVQGTDEQQEKLALEGLGRSLPLAQGRAQLAYEATPISSRLTRAAELKQLESPAGSRLAAAQEMVGDPQKYIMDYVTQAKEILTTKGLKVPSDALLASQAQQAYRDELRKASESLGTKAPVEGFGS